MHIFGASGSGTSPLAAKHGHCHLDTDDFFWLPTDPAFEQPRAREARLALLRSALAASPSWVLSGSRCGWEATRYGHDAIAPGGARHAAHVAFIAWADRHDTGDIEMRSRALHETWLAILPGPVVRLEGVRPVAEELARIEAAVPGLR